MNNTGRKTVKGRKTSAPKTMTVNKAAAVDAIAPARRAPTHDEIAKRSYELFLARGGAHGRHLEDWAQAERDLTG